MKRTDTLLDLIRRYGTVRDFNDFLGSRGIQGASTWDRLIDDRVLPALKKGEISEETLLTYLREAEEYGRQHVFLYNRQVTGPPVPSQQHIRVWLRDNDAEEILHTPRVLDRPTKPQLAEVRRDPFDPGEVLVFKIVQARTYDTLLRTTDVVNGRFSREYEREVERGVNVVRVHPNGLVEVRVYQHKGGSTYYDVELESVLAIMAGLIDPATLHPLSLVRAKTRLYEQRRALSGIVSFSGSAILDSEGTAHTSACKRQRNLFDLAKTEESIAVLTADGEAFHSALNLYWLKQDKKRPKADVHVLLSGHSNEFAITHQCSRGDYEHVLSQLLKFNK